MYVINNTLIILLTSPHFAPSSWWDLHFSAISIQHAEALGGNASTWFLFILLFGSWDLYLSYKYKVLCCVLCVYVMCTDVWTSCSIQLSVRRGRRHAWGRCALITSTIVKVIFCNGVIQDCDCKGGILRGVFWKETACLSCLLGMFCVQGAGLNLHTRTGTKELWCSGQIQPRVPCCRESYINVAISVVYHGVIFLTDVTTWLSETI